MTVRYAAFLRAVNVAGTFVKMADIAEALRAAGFDKVRTFLQSGNVLFESTEKDSGILEVEIAGVLKRRLGLETLALVRTFRHLQSMVREDPFRNVGVGDDVKLFVTFLSRAPESLPELPLVSPLKDIESFRIIGRDVFSLSRKVKRMYGFPNIFIEKKLGIPGTTRNWNTIKRMRDLQT